MWPGLTRLFLLVPKLKFFRRYCHLLEGQLALGGQHVRPEADSWLLRAIHVEIGIWLEGHRRRLVSPIGTEG